MLTTPEYIVQYSAGLNQQFCEIRNFIFFLSRRVICGPSAGFWKSGSDRPHLYFYNQKLPPWAAFGMDG
jgi:hypothetical protein